MNRTLGLDLGSNSLGWAILDDTTLDILDKGVLVFPEGMDSDEKSSLNSPAAVRRAARMGRRMKFRRKLRKWHLLKILIAAKMCPLTQDELLAWKQKGIYPTSNAAFINWLKATDTTNPYIDRAQAAEGRVPPLTLGRALYHICQRRGFKSSRKDEAPAVGDDENEAKKSKKEDAKLGAVKSGIAELSAAIEKAGAKTLGQYFFQCLEADRGKMARARIRGHYTDRLAHYLHEFDAIMDAQGYKANDTLRVALRKAIFDQRPLRSQKHLVGKCPLEPKCARAQIGHPAFEEFRMRSFVSNLVLENEAGESRDALGLPFLTTADRETICATIGPMKAPTFKSVCKALKKCKEEGLHFRYYREDDALPSCPTRASIARGFGDVPYDEQKVFDALMFFDDTELLKGWFHKHYPALDDAAVEKLARIHPKEGNAAYSLKAINRILPYLRRGFALSHARFCAKLRDVIPEFATRESEVLQRLDELHMNYQRDKAAYAALDERARKNREPPKPLHDRYADYLLEEFSVTRDVFDRTLYLRGEDQYVPETEYRNKGATVKLARPRLPRVELGMIRNPLVQRSMTTLRRLVNYLAEHGKLDFSDTIRIELARTVNDLATRSAWKKWQDDNRKKREQAALEITAAGFAATEDAIERWILWDEQGRKCLYTGCDIALGDLLSGNKFDVEHTLPRSLSGDDSLANKTICEANYNRAVKQGRVPRDCPNIEAIETNLRPWRTKLEGLEKTYLKQSRGARGASDPEARTAARVKALVTRFERDYWRDKLRRFDLQTDRLTVRQGTEMSGFKKRQLVDTGIMCAHAVALLKCLYPKTFAVNGAATAFARKAWGIQEEGAKDRSEHTHHAKDAMVIAALSPKRFNAICAALKDDGRDLRRACDICPSPAPGFAQHVRAAANEILVKHILRQTTLRPSSKQTALAKAHPKGGVPGAEMVKFVKGQGDTVRGALHKDTFYGCIADPQTGKLQKVVRKSLIGSLKDADAICDKIVDPAIRALVQAALENLKAQGVKFIEKDMIKMASGVPVNKVRIFMPTAANAQELHDHAMVSKHDYKNPYYVTSAEGSNFRLAVFKKAGKWSVEADNSLVLAQNHKKPDYVPFDRQEGFVGYIKPGTMALTHEDGNPEEVKNLPQKELVKRLYKVVKFEQSGRVTFRRHTEARASVVLSADLKAAGKHAAGESKINLENPHELLLVSPGSYLEKMLFEGIHFKMNLDGSIVFKT